MVDHKLGSIVEALDADEGMVKPETVLGTLDEWDSMGKIAIIAMLDKYYNIQINAAQISALKTVADILEYMKNE